MKTKTLFSATLAYLLVASLMSLTSSAESALHSLRAGIAIDANYSPVMANTVMQPEDGFDTDWDSQPPSIPHEVHEDKVSLSENTCMNCHSKDNYKQENSVKIGKSHYVDRDGTRLKHLSARRYLCLQCHTTQLDVDALVENTYQAEE